MPSPRRWVFFLLFITTAAGASEPVKRTLTGCVVDHTFYSVSQRAYRIATPESLDLRAFEGKGVAMRGWLSPGDRFELEEGERPDVKQERCPADSLRMIRHDQVVTLRVAATLAAQAGEFDRAVALADQAMAVVTPAECDTFTDRAHVLALRGDLVAAGKDLATIRARRCAVDGRMNPLLLQDLGNVLRVRGDRRAAVQALELALAACDGDWCRREIKDDLKAARTP